MADPHANATPGTCRRKRHRIVVVDDTAAIREILSAILTRRGGFEVICAEDGRDALKRFETDLAERTADGQRLLAVDLLVVDIMMPQMTGLELIEAVRRDYARLPRTMVISALDDEAHVVQALQLGAVDYLPKPIDTGLFLHRVQALLGGSSESPYRWAPLPGRPMVMLGNFACEARAVSEAGIIVQRASDEVPTVDEVVPLSSPIFSDFDIPRQVRGRIVRVTSLGRRTLVELSFVGLPDREKGGLRRFSISH